MNNRRRAIMGIKKGRLPSAYQEVEYLRSSGEQWIDTGISPTNTISLHTHISEITATSAHLLGSRISASSGAFTLSMIGSWAITRVGFGSETFDYLAQPADIEAVVGLQSVINGSSHSFTDSVWQSDYNIYLFRMNQAGTIASAYDTYKLHYCSIYDNNVLVRNFIPCYRRADNKPGLYDLVNDVFYTNANSSATQDFIVGPDVN